MFILQASSYLSLHPSCSANPYNIGYCTQNFLHNSSIPALLIDALDLCHFIPLSMTLILAGGVGGGGGGAGDKISGKQKLLASFSHALG